MRAIFTYAGYIKVTTNNWDIKLLVTVKVSSADISWMARWIYMIKLALESAHQSIFFISTIYYTARVGRPW